MKLTKENIYINLRGKSKEELKDIQNVLIIFNEPTFNKDFEEYLWHNINPIYLYWDGEEWISTGIYEYIKNKQEVTIKQLKEILQPMETLQEQLEKAEAEVKRLKEAIEEEIKPKINDWVYNKEEDIIYQKSYNVFNQYEKKITNHQLIELLEKEIK
jgi:anion-transporting  ArsA/GET3 family ATPase